MEALLQAPHAKSFFESTLRIFDEIAPFDEKLQPTVEARSNIPSFHDSPTDDHRAFVLRSSRDETKDNRDLQILFSPLKCFNGIGRETGD